MSLDKRELGKVPVSIGTALALDGLYNRHPDMKPSPYLPASKATQIYINGRTLFRNMYNAIGDTDIAMRIKNEDYAEALLVEIDEINKAIQAETHQLAVYVYFPSYKSLGAYFPRGELKEATTEKRKRYIMLENGVLQFIHDKYKKVEDKPFINIDCVLKIEHPTSTFILTHLPMDLLLAENYTELFLVESHTGRVKSKRLWYTKFGTERDSRIPFNKAMLLFFGDSGNIFKAQHKSSRDELRNIANKRDWNWKTSLTRIKTGLQLSKEPHLLHAVSLLSSGEK